MVDGRILVRGGKLTAVDVAKMVREATESARGVEARAGRGRGVASQPIGARAFDPPEIQPRCFEHLSVSASMRVGRPSMTASGTERLRRSAAYPPLLLDTLRPGPSGSRS